MKKILIFLFFSVCILQVSAQVQEPVLPPMNYSIRSSVPKYTSNRMRVYENGRRLGMITAKYTFQGSPAYDIYSKAIRFNRIGNGLLWSGVGISGSGLMIIVYGGYTYFVYGDNPVTSAMTTIGVGVIVLGLPFIATGIVFKVKGRRRVARAVGMYNDYLASSADNYLPEISLGVTPGGLGVVYKF